MSDVAGSISHWENGRRVTNWIAAPRPVYGGFRASWRRWVREGDNGWDEEFEFIDKVVFTDRAKCEAHIKAVRPRPPWGRPVR